MHSSACADNLFSRYALGFCTIALHPNTFNMLKLTVWRMPERTSGGGEPSDRGIRLMISMAGYSANSQYLSGAPHPMINGRMVRSRSLTPTSAGLPHGSYGLLSCLRMRLSSQIFVISSDTSTGSVFVGVQSCLVVKKSRVSAKKRRSIVGCSDLKRMG